MSRLFLVLFPLSSHTGLVVSGEHPRLWDWEGLCLSWHTRVQGMQGLFYVNFGYSWRGWTPCQECWHRDSFSANPDREPYYYAVMEDAEGIPWDYNIKNAVGYKQLTNGVHLFMPFIGPTYHLWNIQYSLPTSSTNDRVYMIHIKRCIMGSRWGKEPSTNKNHLLEVKRNVIKCKDIVNTPSYMYLGTHPVKYLLGMGPEVDTLMRILDPGSLSKFSKL